MRIGCKSRGGMESQSIDQSSSGLLEVRRRGRAIEPTFLEHVFAFESPRMASLRDLQTDWEQHGKDILELMREKHPEIYFQCMVKLALAHPADLYPPGGSDRRYTPEDIMEELEERTGPEGRRLFESFLRKVKRLERADQYSEVPSST
jgi:hypothetical protein